MHVKYIVPGCLSLAMLIVGCERERSRPTTLPAQTVSTTAPAPASAPTTDEAPLSYIWLDAEPHAFPPAKLMIRSRGDDVSALLFSDDPPSAIRDDYVGNSYYLDMAGLEITDGGTLAGASWTYKAADSERAETVSGIFLHGRRWQLQPFDVRVELDGDKPPIRVLLAGTFLMFDNEDNKSPPRLVTVRAELSATPKIMGRSGENSPGD